MASRVDETASNPDGDAHPARSPGPPPSRLEALFRGLVPVALALVSAGLVCVALPTFELAAVGFFAFAPLLIAIDPPSGRSRRARFFLGWLTGFAFQVVLFRWIPFTLDEMTSFPEALTVVMCILYALWHGLQIALFVAFVPSVESLFSYKYKAFLPIVIAVFYAFIEWAFPSLFPWSFGHAAWELGGLAAPLLAFQGVPLLTAMVVLPSALLATLWRLWQTRAPEPTSGLPPLFAKTALVTTGAFLGVWLLAFGVRELSLGPPDRTLRVAILQPNYGLAEKKQANLAMRGRFLERFDRQLRALPSDTFDLVVASEGAFPMWWQLDADSESGQRSPQVMATRRVQRAVAEGPRAHAIIGGLRFDTDGETRNAAVHLGPDGRILGHYDKQTLVPFSEYVPFADLFPSLKDIKGIGHMAAGDTPCRFEAAGVQVTCGICYESMFAGDTRRDAGDARLLVNLTIDTWFGKSTAPRMHLMSHASRAAELGIPLLRAALTGISALIGPDGQVVRALPLDVQGALDLEVPLPTGTTLYREVGQVFMPLAGLALLAALVLRLARVVHGRRPGGDRADGSHPASGAP